MIDTVPILDKPVSIRIPPELVSVFEEDLRVIVGPWPWGLVLPERLIDRKLADLTREDYDVFLVPKSRP